MHVIFVFKASLRLMSMNYLQYLKTKTKNKKHFKGAGIFFGRVGGANIMGSYIFGKKNRGGIKFLMTKM